MGTLTVYFETDLGTLVGQCEKKEDVGTDNFYVGLYPKVSPNDYIDLTGVRINDIESSDGNSGASIYVFGDPSEEDYTYKTLVSEKCLEFCLGEEGET